MTSETLPLENAILAAWHQNAQPWTQAVREQRIESRRLITNQAIVDAVLSRALDAVPALAQAAQGGRRFETLSYACRLPVSSLHT